jgi:hypothetical protein
MRLQLRKRARSKTRWRKPQVGVLFERKAQGTGSGSQARCAPPGTRALRYRVVRVPLPPQRNPMPMLPT